MENHDHARRDLIDDGVTDELRSFPYDPVMSVIADRVCLKNASLAVDRVGDCLLEPVLGCGDAEERGTERIEAVLLAAVDLSVSSSEADAPESRRLTV